VVDLGNDLARTAGRLVARPLAALARRRRGKPMHPRGAVFDGMLERSGSAEPFGIPWLDEPGHDAVLVRLSRGAGLPAPLPDLLGLAVRIPEGPVDLLLSSSGLGGRLRVVPLPRVDTACSYLSIMGYRTDGGTVRLAALPAPAGRRRVPSDPAPLAAAVASGGLAFTLVAAPGLRPWRPVARLRITAPREPLDPDIRFDAVLNPPPGLVPDGPMARFRAPAYAAARAARDAPPRSATAP
jgi:hypothetical protein